MYLTEEEYIKKYGAYRAVDLSEVESARDILRETAHNKRYIPPTNPEKVFYDLAMLYKEKLRETRILLIEAKKEVTSLKRKN